MTLPDFSELLNNKALLSAVAALIGGFVGNLIAVLRNRVKTLEYTVTHDRVAFASNDPVFGSIQVAWQGHNVTGLFTSRVELRNDTSRDLTGVTLKVYTGDTLLLTERTEIPGTTHVPQWSVAFKQQMHVPTGGTPTPQQFDVYNHNREYAVPVLNRGQRVVMTYLTTENSGSQGPSVWLDMLHEGVRVEYRPQGPQVHGVAQKVALAIGLVASVLVLALSSLFIAESWLAALICLVVGLFAQFVGAMLYRMFRFLKAIVLR
jgi:hypothetical protein